MKGLDFMKKKIFVASREEDEEKVVFQANEETICKWYCAMFGYTYCVEYTDISEEEAIAEVEEIEA